MAEPINIFPGVYKKAGGSEVTGLCIMLDNQDGQWEVTTSDDYTAVIKIKNGAKWSVEEYTDPNTGGRTVRFFLEGAKLNHLAQQFIQPIEEAYAPNTGRAKSGGPEIKIYYTTPEDSNTPPIKIASR